MKIKYMRCTFCRGGGHAVSSEMSGFSPGDLSSHSTSEEDEDTKSQKVSFFHFNPMSLYTICCITDPKLKIDTT